MVAGHQGEPRLVAMLGEGASWVANVRAAGGNAVLRRGRAEAVRLESPRGGPAGTPAGPQQVGAPPGPVTDSTRAPSR